MELDPFLQYFVEHYLALKHIPMDIVKSMFYTLDLDNSADVDFAEVVEQRRAVFMEERESLWKREK